ncbi:SLAP domain-containing protein [Lactobacillus terrae]|uniref:SLAP domain-containing protein n=1 Tax=Lactobacillus terrae TaxID=2269374 RepID=UPI000C1B60B1|nr:SLAP domain-containing protein [Lactobacillus terrae]
MKRKISVILGIVLVAVLSVFLLPANAKADSLPFLYPEEHSAIQVIVPKPILVNKSGVKVVDNNIKLDTNWATPESTTEIFGQYYYQIASDEYILADDAYSYVAINEIIKVTSDVPTPLYTYYGQVIKNRQLAPNTLWYADRIMGSHTVDGSGYFLRVATNEFVRFSDAYLVMN